MDFVLLDRYLLDGEPAKADLVAALEASADLPPAARPFVEGMRMLGTRAPELSFVALRLVLAGQPADDERVVALRGLVERARAGGPDAAAARATYAKMLRTRE